MITETMLITALLLPFLMKQKSSLTQNGFKTSLINKITSLDPPDEYFKARKNLLNFQKKKELNAAFPMKNSRQKNTHTHTKRSIKYIEQKTRNEEKDPRTKTMLEFDHSTACNIKYLAVKKNNEVKPTTRFFSRKMLMFAKLSLISFNYDLLGTFCLPSEKKRKIYEKYMIKIIFPYHVLTDADSTCLHFIFI